MHISGLANCYSCPDAEGWGFFCRGCCYLRHTRNSHMELKKLPADFVYVPEMYSDDYFPGFLVDKVKGALQETVTFIEAGGIRRRRSRRRLTKLC
jgi:hypothetical protein